MEVDDPAYEELRGKHTAVVTGIIQAVRARHSTWFTHAARAGRIGVAEATVDDEDAPRVTVSGLLQTYLLVVRRSVVVATREAVGNRPGEFTHLASLFRGP